MGDYWVLFYSNGYLVCYFWIKICFKKWVFYSCSVYIKIEWIVNEFLLIDFGVIVVIYNYYLSIFFIL